MLNDPQKCVQWIERRPVQETTQDVHSGRWNGALYGRKRRLKRPETAVYCLNFHPISP
jgi:hypothetical protein